MFTTVNCIHSEVCRPPSNKKTTPSLWMLPPRSNQFQTATISVSVLRPSPPPMHIQGLIQLTHIISIDNLLKQNGKSSNKTDDFGLSLAVMTVNVTPQMGQVPLGAMCKLALTTGGHGWSDDWRLMDELEQRLAAGPKRTARASWIDDWQLMDRAWSDDWRLMDRVEAMTDELKQRLAGLHCKISVICCIAICKLVIKMHAVRSTRYMPQVL